MAELAKKNAERTRLLVLVGVLVVVAVIAMVKAAGRDGMARGAAKDDELSYSSRQLPGLVAIDPEGMAGNDDREHRNPFTYGRPPTPTPNLTPKPTKPPVVRPTPRPRPTATPTPAGWKGPPPPFDREFVGHFGPAHLQVAAFRKKTDDPDINVIEVAVVGEVLDGKFIVREIGLESVVIGFVDYDSSEDKRVPLAEE